MRTIGVGLIGTGYMGKCHALAWTGVHAVFDDTPIVRRVMLCEVEEGGRRSRRRVRLGLDRRLARADRGPGWKSFRSHPALVMG
jgi:hypothetical protein